jgi:hypothetical protein
MVNVTRDSIRGILKTKNQQVTNNEEIADDMSGDEGALYRVGN